MSVGKRIKQRRLELKISADHLAKALGKNRATIYRYESDEIEDMPISVLEPLARELRVSPAYLLGWEDEIETIAAHHDGEEWSEEELKDIENFKEFVRMRRKQRED